MAMKRANTEDYATQFKKGRTIDPAIARGDRISRLPDAVISNILSHLPIKDAVRTSVLSKGWESVWTHIKNVNIDADVIFPQPWSDKELFVKFVERILIHLPSIRSFHLTCQSCGESEISRVSTWLSAVLRHDIESLELIMKCDKTVMSNKEDPILPRILLNSPSLKNLVVGTPCMFKPGTSNCFPNLTRLNLSEVKIVNKHPNTDTLVFTFPVLDEFQLNECTWSKVTFVELNAPLLTKFYSTTIVSEDKYYIKIVGATIEELFLRGHYPENIILKDSTVQSAYAECVLPFSEERGLTIRKFLREFSSVESMLLSSYLWDTKYFLGKNVQLPLPRFSDLRTLGLANRPCYGEGLLELLHATPVLRDLSIDMEHCDGSYDYDEAESVPSCFQSHLKEVLFYYGARIVPSFQLERFLLKNGVRLKKVLVSHSLELLRREIVKQLSTFPKASIACLVVNNPQGFLE